MSKEKNVETATAETSNELVTVNNQTMTVEALQAQLNAAEVGQELSSDYFTLEPGEAERVIFMQMTEMQGMGEKKDEMVEAIKFLSAKDGKLKINADKALVGVCKGLASSGKKNVPLEITCTGFAKSKSGFKYKEFSIRELILK